MKTEQQLKATYHDVIRENSGVSIEREEQEVKQQQAAEEKAVIKQTLLVQWNRDGVTQEVFNEITKEINQLETTAREKACGYAVHQNHLEIINLLVRAAELRKLKDRYASSN